jgi:hypothetical protein
MTARLYAQEGDEGTCQRCGRKVEFRVVAHDAVTGEPVYRWVAVRRTKNARIPIQCLAGNNGGHRTADHSCTGAPA